jgi:hypothetical protein
MIGVSFATTLQAGLAVHTMKESSAEDEAVPQSVEIFLT